MKKIVKVSVAVSAVLMALASGCVCGNTSSPAHVRGKITQCGELAGLHPRFEKAFAFMRRPDLAKLPCGRYEIDGTNCWAMIMDSKLKPFAEENTYEVHREFIDIQAPISGNETMGVMTSGPERLAGFNVEKDYVLFKGKGEPWVLAPGDFAVFFPETGAHAPCLSSDGATGVRKLVIKVRK